MSLRDERIFPLCAGVTSLPKIGPKLGTDLEARGYPRVMDLLTLLPRGGIDRTPILSVLDAELPTIVTVQARVAQHIPNRRPNMPYRILVDDAKTRFQLVFFRPRTEYLQDVLPLGEERIISGAAELYENQVQMTHPDYILRPGESLPRFEPVYSSVGGIAPRVLRTAIDAAVERVPTLDEWIPNAVLSGKNWSQWHTAFRSAHQPTGPADLDLNTLTRSRLAFDELFAHQLSLHLGRRARKRETGNAYNIDMGEVERAKATLPFKLTRAQELAVDDIVRDFQTDVRMNRLLQGDVGSGKTAVGFVAAAAMASAGYQSVVMAPTEVLAKQHYGEFQKWGAEGGLRVAALTGKLKGAARQAVLDELANGEIDLLIGTHAVFQTKVAFKALGLAIIDEQHRFGVKQRKELSDKGAAVDTLIMTATPIPRSLALTHFGDMEVSVLYEKPAGRKPIQTVILPETRIDEVTERLKKVIAEGGQAYWVCPLVQQSAASERTAVETRFKLLKKALGQDVVGMIHGQLPSEQKEAALQDFANGETSVLVATTVIEVGVNVPNATIIVVEGANGFGLAQLHQLRGRVGRSDKPSVCVLLYDGELTKTAEERLRALRETNDGFALAELDLKQRGAGDVLGLAQSGLPRFRIANLEVHEGLMRTASDAAKMLLQADPHLTTTQGRAAQTLLHLYDYERAIRFLNTG